MLKQLLTLSWAQWRIVRNHLPRTTFGSLLATAIAAIWYGGFAVLAAFIASLLPAAPLNVLRQWLGIALFGVFLFWQIAPLMTLTGGWSLDLKRLQAFPLSTNVLLGAELVLRITAAGEMLLLLLGAIVGLALNAATPAFGAFAILLYIPFNLLVSLIVRDLLSTAFQKKSYVREIFAVVVISVGVIPQLYVRYFLPRHNEMGTLKALDGVGTPWHGIAALATGNHVLAGLAVTVAWLAVAFGIARWQFARALHAEDLLSAPARMRASTTLSFVERAGTRFANSFADPTGVLIQKELWGLVRMPRFRVIFLLASVFSVVVFLPIQLHLHKGGDMWSQRSLQLMSVYGTLILSDALLWNMFGFDGSATQVYFVTPVPFSAVIRAKNIAAALFIGLQTVLVIAIAFLFRIRITPLATLTSLCGGGVAALLFFCIGNISSVASPRPADAKATLRKQNTGAIQLWMLGCSAGACALLGAAYVAGWAAGSEWATLGVLALELLIGAIAYQFSVESAVERVSRRREEFLAALDKSSSPVSL